ncbi:hypothetical protein PFICI_13230 [Pestalotiopsis fici W106-1]|uniref:Ecp2 effector protein-like domain-containing protein n=1 Tax=Pestalotiopsis fici (strain W106-1 / CGMCC3.15140) TaxID=1229662 RepID=W3WPK6_PESFW|nr:uncharacterized protein PFICI_13230 [Pestalotiopsis fici W106-1]ETS74746.1 hypothetical protein PFICI_13230 [Pestalotiopsis fici W106-1]
MLANNLLSVVAAMLGMVRGAPTSSAATTLAVTDGMVPVNTTMPDGTVKVVWLHKAFQPVAGPAQASHLEGRMKWNPNGNPNQCGESTFTDMTTLGSPDQGDCQVIINQMVSGPGYWQLLQGGDLHANGDWCRVAYHGSCVFGVKTTVIFGLFIGSNDISDVVIEAMKLRKGDPRVQFEGSMPCNSPNGQGGDDPKQPHTTTKWALFKPLAGVAPAQLGNGTL